MSTKEFPYKVETKRKHKNALPGISDADKETFTFYHAIERVESGANDSEDVLQEIAFIERRLAEIDSRDTDDWRVRNYSKEAENELKGYKIHLAIGNYVLPLALEVERIKNARRERTLRYHDQALPTVPAELKDQIFFYELIERVEDGLEDVEDVLDIFTYQVKLNFDCNNYDAYPEHGFSPDQEHLDMMGEYIRGLVVLGEPNG